MYRRPKFLEILDEIRQEMSLEADYDVDLFAELVRNDQNRRPTRKRNRKEIFSIPSIFIENPTKTKK